MKQFINNRKNNGGWIKIVAGIFLLLIFIFVLNLFSSPIRNIFYSLTLPIQKVFNDSGKNTASLFSSILNIKNIQEQNEYLNNENQRLLAKMSMMQEYQEENQAVKDILLCSQEEDFKFILTDIIGFDSNYDIITISKGKNDGILENMPVISSQKVLFGRVLKVYNNFSQVMLISNKNSSVDVKIGNMLDENKADTGVLKGLGNLNSYIDLIPNDLEVLPEQTVFTSALEGIFPKGLIIGKINSAEKNDLKPFQKASVDLFLDPKKSDKLFVITNYLKDK